ncbi:MAG TPA: hypothetical protein VKM55_22330 [Candidatus Lokiarchaeia archaeon]|nr:hypothetical protein [Candidatus Lokiarchaeia archaeon]
MQVTRDGSESMTDEIFALVPNFNEAILSLVFFHSTQSIPLLRYDFQRSGEYQSGYNFNEELLSGMLSAILTVSGEIDREHKSLLRKIDQTTYSIIVSMGKKVGLMLITLKEENEQILREFGDYLLAEFERRYAPVLLGESSFQNDMFNDFIPVIQRSAEIPIAISPELLVDLLPAIRAAPPSVNVVICDKLIFLPIFKKISDYVTPNELQQLSTFLKEIIMGSTKFLDLVQKFGAMETIKLTTAKKRIYIANLDPFYCILFMRSSEPESEALDLLATLNDTVFRDALMLSIRQKAILFSGIDAMTKDFPDLDPALLKKQIIAGLKDFQREKNILFKNLDQNTAEEKKKVLDQLVEFLISALPQESGMAGLEDQLADFSAKFVGMYLDMNT